MRKRKHSKLGRPKGRHLTETDILVIKKIAQEGFQTFAELRLDILANSNRTHAWDLMKKLTQFKFLNECHGDGGGIRGWSLSPKGQTDLQELFDPTWKVDVRPPIYKSAYDHDVALREIKKLLCMSPCVSEWVPEHILKAKAFQNVRRFHSQDRFSRLMRVPDARFNLTIQGSKFKSALELEFTRKAKKRLYQKMEIQITDPSYDFVFYVARDEKLMGILWEIYQAVMAHSSRIKIQKEQNAVYFTTLENLRNQRLMAPFRGMKETLILRNLSPENEIISPDCVG